MNRKIALTKIGTIVAFHYTFENNDQIHFPYHSVSWLVLQLLLEPNASNDSRAQSSNREAPVVLILRIIEA